MNAFEILFWLALLAAVLGVGLWWGYQRGHREGGERRTVLRGTTALPEKELRRILFEWPASDSRKVAALQIICELLESAQLEVTSRGLSNEERTHAAGRAEAMELLLARWAELCEGMKD